MISFLKNEIATVEKETQQFKELFAEFKEGNLREQFYQKISENEIKSPKIKEKVKKEAE